MLTRKDEEVLKYITNYYKYTKFYPNYGEIGKGVKLSSKSSVHVHMNKLEDEGIIIRKADYSAQYRIKDIDKLINDQSKEDGWILCSDRMPENEEEVEITYTRQDYKTGETLYYTARAFHEDGTSNVENSDYCWDNDNDLEYDEKIDLYIIPEGWWEVASCMEDFAKIYTPVIAWRLLGNPYKPN